MAYTYEYPRPSVTTDAVVLIFQSNQLNLLLIERKNPPFQNSWALPGGFLEIEEELESGVIRELNEETGLTIHQAKQIGAYGALNRDPRGRIISIAYFTIIARDELPQIKGSSDAKKAAYFNINDLPALAFDHQQIIRDALSKLKIDLNLQSPPGEPFFDLKTSEIESIREILKKI